MPRYISLIRFTDKGSSGIKQATSRARAFAKSANRAGVTIEGQYWTLGQYDGVLIMNADSEEKVLHYLTLLSAAGYARTETLRAFVDDEFDGIARTPGTSKSAPASSPT